MTPTAVTPAARRDRSATSTRESDSRRPPPARPSSLRSGGGPRASSRAAAPGPRPTAKPAPKRAVPKRAVSKRAVSKPAASKPAPKRSPQRASSARSADHRPSLRASATPRVRRRVSGPSAGPARVMTAGGYGTIALPTRTRRRPRPALPRPSVRLPRLPRLPRVAPPRPSALAHGAVGFVASLPESSLLDRVIRGRIWIPLLGVLLVGIVGMQVENLKLNAGLGGAIEQTSTLQSRNDWLRDDVAQLSDPQRIEGIAARHGMLMGPPSATKFLRAGRTSSSAAVRAAIAGIHAPGSTYFAGAAGTASPTASPTATPAAPSSTPASGG